MKKVIIILLSLLLIGCSSKEKNETIIKPKDNLNIEYGSIISLYDLFDIENGTIISKNSTVNTLVLGNQNIKVFYKDENKKKKNYTLKINVIDSTPPLIISRSTYYIERLSDLNILSLPMCLDNYDKDVTCSVEGIYDNTKIGNYNMKFISTDSNSNKTEKSFIISVIEKYENDDYYNNEITIKDAIKKYKNENTMIGIDVSSWQDEIDFQKVKNSGVEFVMIRIGFGHNDEGKIVLDNRYKNNIKNAKKANLKVGIYFYSYAKDITDIYAQTKWIIKTLNGEKLDLPIAFDWEDWENFDNYNFNLIEINNIARTFMDLLQKEGYKSMNYGSALYLENIWQLDNYRTWLAHYTEKTDFNKDYLMWQFSNTGIVDGINGYVDLNVYNKNKE